MLFYVTLNNTIQYYTIQYYTTPYYSIPPRHHRAIPFCISYHFKSYYAIMSCQVNHLLVLTCRPT